MLSILFNVFFRQVVNLPITCLLVTMLQGVVCKDLVGWRENSQKILLIMNDDFLQTVCDGRLAGIVKPNDGSIIQDMIPLTTR